MLKKFRSFWILNWIRMNIFLMILKRIAEAREEYKRKACLTEDEAIRILKND